MKTKVINLCGRLEADLETYRTLLFLRLNFWLAYQVMILSSTALDLLTTIALLPSPDQEDCATYIAEILELPLSEVTEVLAYLYTLEIQDLDVLCERLYPGTRAIWGDFILN